MVVQRVVVRNGFTRDPADVLVRAVGLQEHCAGGVGAAQSPLDHAARSAGYWDVW
jgi:hypothetical protein